MLIFIKLKNKLKKLKIYLKILYLFKFKGKFEAKTEQEHAQIESIIENILKSWRVVGVRMRRHVLNIVRASCEWINEEKMVKFEDLVDDAEMNDEIDHDYNSDEMAEKLFEEHSSESDDSRYENPDDTESDSDDDDSDDSY